MAFSQVKENTPKIDFASLVTDEVLRTYFKYPIPKDKVLFNKRGKPKKSSREELISANVAATKHLVLATKRATLKMTRAERNIPTTTVTPFVEALPSEASMPKDSISKIFVPKALASGVIAFKAVVPKASKSEVPILEVSVSRTLAPETTMFKAPAFEVPGVLMSEAFITLALALAASPTIAHPSGGTIENAAHQSFEAPNFPDGIVQRSCNDRGKALATSVLLPQKN